MKREPFVVVRLPAGINVRNITWYGDILSANFGIQNAARTSRYINFKRHRSGVIKFRRKSNKLIHNPELKPNLLRLKNNKLAKTGSNEGGVGGKISLHKKEDY